MGKRPPLVHEVAAESVVEQTVSVVSEEVAHSGGALIGVVCPPSLYIQTAQAVARAHADRTGTAQTALENQVLVLTPWEAKGLEFDVVVIVEPQQLIDDADGAVGDLYVSMTRPTQRLHMVGSRIPRACSSVALFLLFLLGRCRTGLDARLGFSERLCRCGARLVTYFVRAPLGVVTL